jgi:aryl-alcohol dehydrogenase-like predicted oxidoreductase
MRYRELGRTGLQVSEIGYGTWGLGGDAWKGGSDEESLRALCRAIELGLNFFDTALCYGNGHSERLVGQALRETGAEVIVATKVPPMNGLWPARPGISIDAVFPARHIVDSTEASLRNLGVETIDVQQLHVWNPDWTGRTGWFRALEDLKRSGKVRFIGISVNAHQPDSALGLVQTGLIDAVQVIYNIFEQSPERSLLPLCRERGVGVIARCPLDEGSLTGTITKETQFEPDDYRARYFGGARREPMLQRVAALEADLAGVPGSLAEIALRFTLAHPAVAAVIPGMRRVRNVEANCALSDGRALKEPILEILKRHDWDWSLRSS